MQSLYDILPPERILDKLIDRLSFAPDAGFYHLVPEAVVRPVSESEIIALFGYSRKTGKPLVFRAGGTSLSGQSVTDGILVDLSQHWRGISVEAEGRRVRVQPGITGAMVNTHLKRQGRKIGPDPSSIVAAMMGGILSNNASGMCCGTRFNSYHTTRFVRFILPGGNVFSTENGNDYAQFASLEPGLYGGLAAIREKILGDPVLSRKIREKYLMKNTVGYSLNAFLDHEHPLDIFAHLLVGAEGTLGFIAEAVLDTIPDPRYNATAMLYFTGIREACRAIVPLAKAGAAMVELMDRASLRAVEKIEGIDPLIRDLPEGAAALLVEFQEEEAPLLEAKVNAFLQDCGSLSLLQFPVFTEDEKNRNFLWKIRKGLFPSVGAVRKRGTSVILEDIAFPIEKLGDAITDLQALFATHGYSDAIIFGHAKDGNIHFVVTQAFDTDDEVSRYDAFIRDLVKLVVDRYDGTLKAEHGTGRNMAPFVETEWGEAAYRIMQQVKSLADKDGLLNPGVIINGDPQAHISHLKEMPAVEEEVDKCIECGYCEPSCPSRDYTTSPRRRIVVRRALAKLKAAGNRADYETLRHQFRFDGMTTCAVDGLCAVSCPVDINTGDLIKRLRHESHSPMANRAALFAARHFRYLEAGARFLLGAGTLMNRLFGAKTMYRLSTLLKKIYKAFPLWPAQLPAPPGMDWAGDTASPGVAAQAREVLYFPSCISRMMGTYPGRSRNIMECFVSVCKKAGIGVRLAADFRSACCSQIFSSKGYQDAARYKANATVAELWKASGEGRLQVVIDVSSCAYTLKQLRPLLSHENKIKYDRLRFRDIVEFLHESILPLNLPAAKKESVMLHPVCSLEKMHVGHLLREVAAHFAREVTVPVHAGCCGMAGDRGFIAPGLTASATRAEAEEVMGQSCEGYYATTRTCEIALSQASGRPYESILYLLDDCL